MEELLDIVDSDGIATGIVKTRKETHAKGYLHKTVHIWIVDKDNRILIQKRSATKSTHPLMWDVSCAGHLSAGETSREASVKELYEELGIRVNEDDLIYITTIEKKHFQGKIKDHELYDVFMVKMQFELNLLKPDKNEVEEIDAIAAETFFKNVVTQDDFINNDEEYSIMKKVILNE